ncbi:MAG: hypothetical protein C4541_05290 [Candidatus Auribacter fodinae]|jgi:hypothetical protein|uniref:Uncharacterized protein n=1 Tax=Candidatus Auribacter fodinae TaxID=2093366 RepID=A0A3A4R4G9_9BACT|nr:MAG: hypothetical protein C4541_05290 [Candidatus Auribacter fodinae]
MEQRDAIVRNLREISHFFLSESKPEAASAVAQPQASAQPVDPSKKNAVSHPKNGIQPEKQQNPSLYALPDEFVQNEPQKEPAVIYLVHNGEQQRILETAYRIGLRLAHHNIRCSIIGPHTFYYSIQNQISSSIDVTHKNMNNNAIDIAEFNAVTMAKPLTIIGRTDNTWGAQLKPHLEKSDIIFIADCSYSQIENLIQGKTAPSVIFFCKPSPEEAFNTYYRAKKLFQTNPHLWSGLIVTNASEQSEALKISGSISKTLVKYGYPSIHFLGNVCAPERSGFTADQQKEYGDIAQQLTRSLLRMPLPTRSE